MTERGPVEIRSATIDVVAYPDRTLSLVVVPYDEWTPVVVRDEVVEESFAPGAFGAIRNRARRFLVNMEHDASRWVGSVLDLDGVNTRGLLATVKVRRSPEGDQALDDAADGLLGASIGFAASPSDMDVTKGRRRIRKAYLDHIALTATPAYAGAEVLEVRSSPSVELAVPPGATPNLERALALMSERGVRSPLT
jgi:HK97 family phage prohead protease